MMNSNGGCNQQSSRRRKVNMARQIQRYVHTDKIYAFFEPVGGGETVNLNNVEMVKWADVAPHIKEMLPQELPQNIVECVSTQQDLPAKFGSVLEDFLDLL